MRIFRNSDEWEEAGCPKDEGDWGFSTFTHGRLFTVRDGEWQAAGNWNEGFDLSPLRPFLSVGEGPPRNSFGCGTRRTIGTISLDRPSRFSSWHTNGVTYSPQPGSRAAGLVPAGKYWIDVEESPFQPTFTLRMYGYLPDTPDPQPEKSPIDREIEKMMERRKAKRENPPDEPCGITDEAIKAYQRERKEIDDGRALDRALSKAFTHHSPIAERLAPWKVVRG